MSKIIAFTAPRQVGLEEYEGPALEPNEVRLRSLYSSISAGTKLTADRGFNPYVHKWLTIL